MTITNPGSAGETIRHDATDAARQALRTISISLVAPETFAGKLQSQENLVLRVEAIFERAPQEAARIAAAAREDIDKFRVEELKGDPFSNECLRGAARSVAALPEPLDTDGVKATIKNLIGRSLQEACEDVDRTTASRFKTRQGAKRKQLKGEIDLLNRKLQPVLVDHIAGLVRDELAGELTRRYEACERSLAELRRHVAQAADPGDEILGAHRFSLSPRLEVLLKAAAKKRPDLLDRDGRPTEAIWPAFGAFVAAGDPRVLEDPQEAIGALQRFLESLVTSALDGLTLDSLYSISGVPPETPSWISRAAARMRYRSPRRPNTMRLAQVPAADSDHLLEHVGYSIENAKRGEEDNRLQLMELTYSYSADEVLSADPRGLEHVLTAALEHASSPKLHAALQARLALLRVPRPSTPGLAAANGGTSQSTTTSTP
jgi:hypothetical protein